MRRPEAGLVRRRPEANAYPYSHVWKAARGWSSKIPTGIVPKMQKLAPQASATSGLKAGVSGFGVAAWLQGPVLVRGRRLWQMEIETPTVAPTAAFAGDD